MELFELIERARGDAPADLLLTGCRVVNVHTGEVLEQDIAIAGGRIAGVGPGYEAKQRIDLGGRIVCPGLIDAHVHVESGMVTPDAFARSVVTRGTTAVIADPHEIANVWGLEGIRYMLNVAAGAPIDVFVMASSCVPATAMETSGASLSAAEIASLRDEPRVLGLAEMMNFPGVVHGAPEVLAKLDAFAGTVIDGHAPGLGGKGLNAYVAAGIGSDHECLTAQEATERLRLGMYVLIREG
ncbi:MAG: amidohydrolase family protein, partial [Planctomycetota bacterium]